MQHLSCLFSLANYLERWSIHGRKQCQQRLDLGMPPANTWTLTTHPSCLDRRRTLRRRPSLSAIRPLSKFWERWRWLPKLWIGNTALAHARRDAQPPRSSALEFPTVPPPIVRVWGILLKKKWYYCIATLNQVGVFLALNVEPWSTCVPFCSTILVMT